MIFESIIREDRINEPRHRRETVMTMILINTMLAIAPALFLLYYFYRKDTLRPEPKQLVFKALLLGILIVIPVGIIETLLSPITRGQPMIIYALVTGFGIAAVVEEGFKYFVVTRWIVPNKAFDETTDGIVYTIAASMGFALFENIMYSYQAPVSTALLRGFTAVPLHAIASGIMGYYIGANKFDKNISRSRGLFLAIMIHGLYDFFLMSETLLAFLIVPVLWIGWKRLQRLFTKAQTEDRYYGRS